MTAGRRGDHGMRGVRRAAWLVTTALVGALAWEVSPAPPAVAAPLPAPYAATAAGNVVTVQSSLLGATLAATDLVYSGATVASTSPAPSTATSANLGLQVGPIGVGTSNVEAAPPTHSESGSLAAVGVPGVLSTGLLTYTDSVRWDGSTSCPPLGVPFSSAVTQTAGASLDLLGIGVVDTGVSSVTTSTGLVAVSPTRDTRAVAATTQGSMAGLSLLDGAVTVSALQPSLTATATSGQATSANLSGSAVTVTGPGGAVSLAAGATANVTVPLVGSVSLRLASNADVTAAGGTFSTTYLTATVSLLGGTGTVSLGILPLSVSATAPTGGVECDTTAPAVAITTPADGSTTNDTTPAISGTSDVLSGSVQLVLDGGTPVTVPTDASGAWTYTPPSPLTEASHTAVVTATDGAGNAATDTSTFVVDVVPAVDITAPPSGSTTNDATPTVTGTSTTADGTVTLSVDGGALVTVTTAADGSWSWTPPSALADGPHTVVATAADTGGNSVSDTVTFTVDATAPVIAITAPADGSTTNDSTPTVNGTSDVLSGTIEVTIDGGTPVSVPTDGTGNWTHTPTTPLGDGDHTVVATATDAAGNTSTDTVTFAVDATAPVITITAPADGSTTTDSTPTISGTSDVLSGTIQLVIDGGTPVTVTTDATGAWTHTPDTALADGPHSLVASATDAAGNTTTDTVTFTVDATAPAIAITAPADGSTTGDSTPTVTGTSNVLSGTIQVSVDGGTPVDVPTDGSGTWTFTPATPLADGDHTITASATDGAGNTSTDTATVTVDTAAPSVTIATPADGSTTNDSTPTISGTSDVLSGTIQLVIDGGTPIDVTTDATGAWTHTPGTALADGDHTVVVTATDAAGNTTTDTVTFTVDATAPAIAITTPADGSSTNDSTPAVTGTSDVLSGTIQVTIDGGTPVDVTTDGTGAWTHTPTTPLADGDHTVVATATDAAGNSSTDEVTFVVDTAAPVVAIGTPADGSTTTDATPTITGTSDVLNGTIQVTIDGGTPVDVTTDGTGTWTHTPTTPLGDGDHTVVATATDAAGNTASDESTFTVAAPVADVSITTPGDGSTTTDSTPTVGGRATPGTRVVVRIDGGPALEAVADEAGYWDLVADEQACGPHTITATVGDGDDAVTAESSFTLSCDTSPASPGAPGLPRTGSDAGALAGFGLLLTVAGALLLRTARRRRPTS